ncbi:MAG: WD40 repeat domain-containing protein [Phycisphaerae bacterium]|nr:WD40 repeat domain-containing protein [Phycisphaerae bacterium]
MTNINNTENGKWTLRLPVLIFTTVLTALLVALGLAYIHANIERNHAITARKRAWRQGYLARTETEKAKRDIYRYEISETTHLLEKEKWDDALSMLKALNPDFRGWECGLLMNRASVELFTLCKYSNGPCFVSCSPDGKRLASANENCITIWDALTRKALMKLHGDTNTIDPIAFSPDGKRLASAGAQGVKLWDPVTGKMLLAIDGDSKPVISVTFSPDGKQLAAIYKDKAIKILDTVTGTKLLVLQGRAANAQCVAFSPDGKQLASGSWKDTITFCHATTGKELRVVDAGVHGVFSIAFSPDGKHLAVGGWTGVRLSDTATGKELFSRHGASDYVRSLAFSPDGETLTAAGSGFLILMDAYTGTVLRKFKNDRDSVYSLAFSPDGKRLISGSDNDAGGPAVQIWDTAIHREQLRITVNPHSEDDGPWTSWVNSVSISPDNKRLAAGDTNKMITIWDTTAGKELLRFTGHSNRIEHVAFAPDGKRLVSVAYGESVKLWNSFTGKELTTLDGYSDWVRSIAFSLDGKQLAVGSRDGTIKIRNAVTGKEQITLKSDAYVAMYVTFSADGKRLASLGSYRHRKTAVKIWDTVTGQELQTFEETFLDVRRGPDLIALSPDGQHLVWASWRGLWLWDAVTGTKLFGLKGHGGDLQSVAFSPDGKRLVSGSESWGDGERTIRIWDTISGKELLSLDGAGDVLSLAFSPDGKLLASGNSRNTVTIWKTLDWTKPPK